MVFSADIFVAEMHDGRMARSYSERFWLFERFTADFVCCDNRLFAGNLDRLELLSRYGVMSILLYIVDSW